MRWILLTGVTLLGHIIAHSEGERKGLAYTESLTSDSIDWESILLSVPSSVFELDSSGIGEPIVSRDVPSGAELEAALWTAIASGRIVIPQGWDPFVGPRPEAPSE
jgi:hypothetical protein